MSKTAEEVQITRDDIAKARECLLLVMKELPIEFCISDHFPMDNLMHVLGALDKIARALKEPKP